MCIKRRADLAIDKQFQFSCIVMLLSYTSKELRNKALKQHCIHRYVVIGSHVICNCEIQFPTMVPCIYLLRYVCVNTASLHYK